MPAIYTSPEVILSSPSNGATEVAVSESIQVTFSVSMAFSEDEHASLGRVTDPRIFYVTRQIDKTQTDVPGSITYNPITKVAKFTPTSNLVSNATYIITVIGGDTNSSVCAQDIRGNKMGVTYNAVFHTTATTISIPSTISPTDKSEITGEVELSWSAVDSQVNYTLEISPKNDFVLTIVNISDIFTVVNNTVTFKPSYEFTEGRYYWRVKRVNGEFCPPSQFFYKVEQEAAPAAPASGKPYVVSSYPRNNSIDSDGTTLKLKFNEDIESMTLAYGTDVLLVEGKFTEEVEDIDILPITLVTADLILDGKIIEIDTDNPLDYGKDYSIITTGDLDNNVIKFTVIYEFITGFIDDIIGTISKYLNVDLGEVYKEANKVAQDAFDMCAETYTATGNMTYQIDKTDPPRQVVDYIMYQTEYNLLLQKYMDLTSSGSSVILADFTVTSTVTGASIQKFLDILRKKIQEFEDWLKGITNRGKAAMETGQFKGDPVESTGYPDYLLRGDDIV